MPYQSLTLHVLSGTGNSLRAARWAEELARAQGVAVELRPLESGRPHAEAPAGPAHLVGLALPTHGFTAPWSMLLHTLRLPRGRGTHAFVLATRAGVKLGPVFFPGMEGTATWLLALVLLLKGYRVRGVTGLDMPSNWTALHSGMRPESCEAIVARARPVATRFFERILAGNTAFRGFLCLLLGLLLAPASAAYLFAGRFMLARLFFADSRCTGCGQCARQCPVGAVRMRRGRPYWSHSCESCMRCMSFCPQEAIQAGHSWALLLGWLAMLPFSAWIFGALGPALPFLAQVDHPALRLAVDYALMLAVFSAGYLCFWWLLRIPAVNALFAWTTLTRFYRRYREPQTTAKDLDGVREGRGI